MRAILVILLFIFLPTAIFSQNKTSFTLSDTNVTTNWWYRLKSITFQLGKATILPQSFPELDSVVTFLQKNKNIVIEIGVHADSRQSINCCDKPTQNRAQNIADYLTAKGIAVNRMVAKGYGKTKLKVTDAQIAKAKTTQEKEALHALNRRVELRVLSLSISNG